MFRGRQRWIHRIRKGLELGVADRAVECVLALSSAWVPVNRVFRLLSALALRGTRWYDAILSVDLESMECRRAKALIDFRPHLRSEVLHIDNLIESNQGASRGLSAIVVAGEEGVWKFEGYQRL